MLSVLEGWTFPGVYLMSEFSLVGDCGDFRESFYCDLTATASRVYPVCGILGFSVSVSDLSVLDPFARVWYCGIWTSIIYWTKTR